MRLYITSARKSGIRLRKLVFALSGTALGAAFGWPTKSRMDKREFAVVEIVLELHDRRLVNSDCYVSLASLRRAPLNICSILPCRAVPA